MSEMKQAFDPMVYDALLELTTRIGGQYVEWERQATALEEQERWKQAGIALRAQVRAIDPDDVVAIETKRLELRKLFQSLDEQQRLGVRNTLAALWHEGFELTREDVENLTNYAAGIIDANEYRARAHATVGVYHGSEEAL